MNLIVIILFVIIISITITIFYEEVLHSIEQKKIIDHYLNSELYSSNNTESINEVQPSITTNKSSSISHDIKKIYQEVSPNHFNINKAKNENVIKIETTKDNIVEEKFNKIETIIGLSQNKLAKEERISSDYNRKEIGELGEILVYKFLEKMKNENDTLFHESKINGNHNAAGYDIKFITKNIEYLIEVKSTKGPLSKRIILTSNEVNKMENCGNSIYCIYRVYDVDLDSRTGKLVRLTGKKEINEFLIREGINNRRVSFSEA